MDEGLSKEEALKDKMHDKKVNEVAVFHVFYGGRNIEDIIK